MTARFWIGATALVHFAFTIVEMFLWDRLAPRVAPELTTDGVAATEMIAFNMGLYNGFFAVGLTVTLLASLTAERAAAIQVFILICVVVAGIVGFLTLGGITFLAAQAAPAVIALFLMRKERV